MVTFNLKLRDNTWKECTLDLFAELCIKELWNRHFSGPVGDSFDAFVKTAVWVADVLRYAFEAAGSTPNVHWSDAFLEHWARMLGHLDNNLGNLGRTPNPRHAWEILRVAGLPLPSKITKDRNALLAAPAIDELNERDGRALADLWQDVVDNYVLPAGAIAILLASLDKQVVGSGSISPWRGLGWPSTYRFPPATAAPLIGQVVFTSSSSPTLLSTSLPTRPAPVPSWWGVTSDDLELAKKQLREERPLEPVPGSTSLVEVIPGDSGIYLLNTRTGSVTDMSTAKTWKVRVRLDVIKMVYREDWRTLTVSPLMPTSPSEGDAWLNPDLSSADEALEITGKGAKVERASFGKAGDNLLVEFDLLIEYSARNEGKWPVHRELRLNAKVKDYVDGKWGQERFIDTSVEIIVPSPFNPTVVVARKKHFFAPGNGIAFSANAARKWEADRDPSILLPEEGTYRVGVYDGCLEAGGATFSAVTTPNVNGDSLSSVATVTGQFEGEERLDEGDSITASDPGGSSKVLAVISVKERSGNKSSGLLSAVRGLPAAQRPPSAQARSSFLGQFQAQVINAIANPPGGSFNSLYQYVVSSIKKLEEWPEHGGSPAPIFSTDLQGGINLPGIGNGPSGNLTSCAEWASFMGALSSICVGIGLKPESSEFWLSGFDPSMLEPELVRSYALAHRDLVRAARNMSPQDEFWASYPFSVCIVEGTVGASFGQLLAVLLSPLHPARLAWSFAVAFTARKGGVDSSLLGLAEGWNIPCTGRAVSPGGKAIELVAVPTDPGEEQDFATWSALAVLPSSGLAELPPSALGLPLPWGGRTGMNDKVIEQAIKDYLATHPHLNSLEVDIRSVSESPRSREIDEAALRYVGSGTLAEVNNLGGGSRVWDSTLRIGTAPTRDALFIQRGKGGRGGPFEWRQYTPPEGIPVDADLALIENSSVHLAITGGSSNGVVGPLPLRRFCPPRLEGTTLDQNYFAKPGDDLLGLADLLVEIECPSTSTTAALRANPLAHALGIGMGGRWEVLGTFNLDPSLLASVVAEQGQSSGKRLLWEWRPSWLGHGKGSEDDLARRPYYVVARMPASLLNALEYRQGLIQLQAVEMLAELGQRGIGMASLHASGGTQESAASGFFYALRLLLPTPNRGLAAGWISSGSSNAIHGVVPVDPIEPILEGLVGENLKHRADLLVVRITREASGGTHVCFVPVEVKHHGSQAKPEPFPDDRDSELKRARQQLEDTADLIERIEGKIRLIPGMDDQAPGIYARLLGLATLLDLAMSFAPVAPTAVEREAVLGDILNGRVSVGLGDPVLLWFAPGAIQPGRAASSVDPHGLKTWKDKHPHEVYIDPSAVRGLWWEGETIGPDEQHVRSDIDDVMGTAFSACPSTGDTPADGIRSALTSVLGLSEHSASLSPGVSGPVSPSGGSTPTSPIRPLVEVETAAKETLPVVPAGIPPREGESAVVTPTTENQVTITSEEDGNKETGGEAIEDGRKDRVELHPPRALAGWTELTSRWTLLGKLAREEEAVGLDLDHPKAMGIFGYMGSGKSYLLGTVVEAALEHIPEINMLPSPLAVIIFNYRRNATDRFELSSLAIPNREKGDVERLAESYGTTPRAVRDIEVLCLPGELGPARLEEYDGIHATELFFAPSALTVEDWELLMGEPGSEAVFARTIRHALTELRSAGSVTLEDLEDRVLNRLTRQSRTAAELRFDFVRQYISEDRGVDFGEVIRPGRALIVDLRQPLFNKSDALRFFLVCASQISQVQGKFNKMIVFDEAHEYLSDEFGERIESRIRQMRHEGTSYVFATQDVASIPSTIRRFITTRFVFNLGTRENIDDLLRFAPEFKGQQMQGMNAGYCLLQANPSTDNFFERPRLVHVRPRVTQHGGGSRIFSN